MVRLRFEVTGIFSYILEDFESGVLKVGDAVCLLENSDTVQNEGAAFRLKAQLLILTGRLLWVRLGSNFRKRETLKMR